MLRIMSLFLVVLLCFNLFPFQLFHPVVGASSVASTAGGLVDTTAPAIISVSVPSNGSYKNGDYLDFIVNFSESVTVTGTPILVLEIGGQTKYATYQSGNESNQLVFRYIVSAGDIDNDGIAINELQLDWGTIRDSVGNNANLTLDNMAPTGGINVVQNSMLTPITGAFDKHLVNMSNVPVTMTLNGNTLSNIKNGTALLVLGTDYTVVGNAVTIKKEYLVTQVVGLTTLIFTFSAGDSQNVAITINDTTPTYLVTYDGNGSTGGAIPVDSKSYREGSSVTVLGNSGNLVKAGNKFVGWNTAANGSGTAYAATATINMGKANVTLYAQWNIVSSGGGGGVNDAPVAVNDSYTVTENSTLTIDIGQGVLANDSDIDGNSLTAQLVTGPSHGTLTIKADGSFTYTPVANYSGTDSFTYKANDGTSESNVATVTITIRSTTAPEVISINRHTPVSASTNATSVTYKVTFSEAVTGVDVSDFTLTITGTASGSIASVNGSGETYEVTVDGITGVGTLRLDLKPTGTGIVNGSSLEIETGYTAGQAYTVGTVAPTITTQPSNQTITAGGSVTFTVTATGDAPLSYQWKKDGVDIQGATSANLTINSVQASDAGNYTVVVTNAVGNAASNTATLTVTPAPVAPTITTQPSNQTITAGGSATFTVTATGDAPLSYRWKKDGVDIVGATRVSLTINNVQAIDAGNYMVVVTNAVGNVTSNAATLTVTPPPLATRPSAPSVTVDDVNNTILGITELMEYKIVNGNWTTYDPETPPDLRGNKTVIVRMKATVNTLAGEEVILTFTTSSSGGGSSPVPQLESTPTPQPKTEQIVVNVDGNDGKNLIKTPIIRTTELNGTVKDKVNLTYSIVKEIVQKAKEQGVDTARIILPDKEDKVAEVKVEVPKAALEELNKGNLKLEIATPNAVISIPTTSIDNFNQDLYFRIVPIKSESEKKQVEDRAKNETLIQETVGNNTVLVLGRPMEIETNMQSRQVSIVLPLTATLPTNPAERKKVLNNLGVFIEHSDGTKELIDGTVVKMKDGSEGLEFAVNKFSTFSMVYLDGWKDEVVEKITHTPYIKGYSNNEFRPNALVTRAQMATMLAQNLEVPSSTKAYADVKSSHWAFDHVMEVKAAGIMTGVNQTTFNLNGNVTRAQMASIAYRWVQKQCEKDALAYDSCAKSSDIPEVSFKDITSKHWAAEAIIFTKAAGIMVGFEDNTFKPNQELTRAQAVKVINILFKRGPLTNVVTPTFKDVPKTHWASGDVEEAASEHDIILDANR